jgi:hypothetical protein
LIEMSTNDKTPPPEQEPAKPIQEIEDALPHPWVGPSPEAKAEAEPAKHALKEAIREIKTPEQAAQVADQVMAAASGTTEREVREQGGAEPEPARAIEAAAATPGVEKAPATIVEAAKQVAGSSGETREALEQALQEATNPEHKGTTDPTIQAPRDMLLEELLKRMKPLQALDARLFVMVNHLPHTRVTNWIMYAITTVMNGGMGWVLGLVAF